LLDVPPGSHGSVLDTVTSAGSLHPVSVHGPRLPRAFLHHDFDLVPAGLPAQVAESELMSTLNSIEGSVPSRANPTWAIRKTLRMALHS
jgi:hypothetical protein